ncbi:MAG: PAS domain-containing sensor histidine kinase [Planctomycetota bacterium]|jgi:signal transduction histidine kinase
MLDARDLRSDGHGDDAGAALLGAVLDELRDGVVVVDAGGRIRVWNEAAGRLLGPPPEGDPDDWARRLGVRLEPDGPPCPADRFPLVAAVRGRPASPVELFVRNDWLSDGAWVRTRAETVREAGGRVRGLVVVLRDVTSRKRVELALTAERVALEQQARRQAALAEIELAISEPRELRSLLQQVVELAEQQLPAGGATVVLHDADRETFEVGAASLAGRAQALREQRVRTEGATRWIVDNRQPLVVSDVEDDPFGANPALLDRGIRAYAGVPLLHAGEGLGALFVLERRSRSYAQADLDFLKALASRAASAIVKVRLYERIERLVRQRTAELEASHKRLRVADRLASIGTLTAGLGHDMNNVLFPVRCRLDALDTGPLPPEARDVLQAVTHAVEYLQQLSDGLRLFALDPDDAAALAGRTDVHEWWRQVSPLLAKALPEHLALDARIADGLPIVRVPPHRLTQAVLNLVVNAGEATDGPGVVRVAATASADRRTVGIEVVDEGQGMSPEVRLQAFDPFFTTKTRRLSTGLGLSLVHGVVQAAGGTVDVDTAPGRGTCVRLVLPAEPALTSSPPAPPGDRGAAAVSLADPHTAAWVAGLLRTQGFEVRRSSDRPTGAVRVWVTDADRGRLATARDFLDGDPDRRVIAFGPEAGAWRELGAEVVGGADDLEAIRTAVGRVVPANGRRAT